MVSPVQNASTAARAARKKLSGSVVILERDTLRTSGVVATVGETRVEELIQGEIIVSVRMRDFFIDAADYGFSGERSPPRVDDRIIQEIDGRSVVFQVTPASNEREYRRSDRFGNVWRVHTKEARGNEVTA